MWLHVIPIESKCTSAVEEYWKPNSGTSILLTEWKAFKAVMRGAVTHAISSYRAELQENGLALEKQVVTQNLPLLSDQTLTPVIGSWRPRGSTFYILQTTPKRDCWHNRSQFLQKAK